MVLQPGVSHVTPLSRNSDSSSTILITLHLNTLLYSETRPAKSSGSLHFNVCVNVGINFDVQAGVQKEKSSGKITGVREWHPCKVT